MRRYNMEIEKGIPKIGGRLSPNLGQDAKMQPTPKGIVGKSTSWLLLLLCSSLLASCLSTLPDINNLRTFAEDRRSAPFAPTPEELTTEMPFVVDLGILGRAEVLFCRVACVWLRNNILIKII